MEEKTFYKESVNEHFQLLSMDDNMPMLGKISDYEESSEFNNFIEDKFDLKKGINKDVSDSGLQLEKNGIKNGENTELDLFLEKELSNVDISKDGFHDIKMIEEDIIHLGENVPKIITNRFQNCEQKDVLDARLQLEENGIKTELDELLEKDLSNIDFDISKNLFDDMKINGEDITNFGKNVPNLTSLDVLDSSLQLDENGIKINGEKTELGILLKKDLSNSDLDKSNDIFESIKLNEEDITDFGENVPKLFTNGNKENNTNLKLSYFNKKVEVDPMICKNSEIKRGIKEIHDFSKHVEKMAIEDCMEIPFSSEEEKTNVIKRKSDEVCSTTNDEIKRLMFQTREKSLSSKISQSNGLLDNNKKCISNNSFNLKDVGENYINDVENFSDYLNNKENIPPSALASRNFGVDTCISHNNSIDIQNPHQQEKNSLNESEEANEKQCEKKLKLDDLVENNDVKKNYGVLDVIVPLIGKNVMEFGNDAPFTQRYDLARKRNAMRAKFQKNDPHFPVKKFDSIEEWRRKRQSRSKEEIAAEEKKKLMYAIELAKRFTIMAIKILSEYEKDEPNEATMIKFFRYFEYAPASPLSLLYAPHMVHTIMLCRGDEELSPNLRRAANECYDKCHALFPIPEGYNFETVFTSDVKKYIPKELDHLDDLVLDYGDYDSSDFEDEESDCSNDTTDKDWE